LKKIKIVHLVNGLGWDGTGRVVIELCKLFEGYNYEISVVSLTPDVPLSMTAQWPGNVRVYSYNYYYDEDYSLRRYLLLYFNRRITCKRGGDIIHRIENLEPDILHCHLQPRELIIALLAVKNLNTKLLFTDHLKRLSRGQYSLFNLKMLAWIYRQILRRFHVVAVSKSVWEYHREFSLTNHKRVHALIENRIDASRFVPGSQSPGNIKIIYVARLHKRKGHEILIKAWAKITSSDKKMELILVGGGDEEMKTELKSLVKTLAPCHPIIFEGDVEEVLPYLQTAHIGVFPSLQEGLPLSLLEMMSCGLPVIASDIEEIKEIITDMKNGVLFKAGDPDDLYGKLELLLNDKDLCDQLGKFARELIINHYSIKGLKEEYERVYTKILSLQ
jgi:glycosyltransferase involved in cell wall biosynthesis